MPASGRAAVGGPYGDEAPQPYLRGLLPFGGPIDRWQIYEWRIRGNLLILESGLAPAGSGAFEGAVPDEAFVMRSVQALTPSTESSTHYFFMQAHDHAGAAETLTPVISQAVRRAFLEDKAIIEAQQRLLLEQPDAPMTSIPADAALHQGRRMLQRMLDAERG